MGGGTIADTISDVPSAIDGLLGNYKKIAIIKTTINLTTLLQKNEIKIPLNLDFKPNRILVHIWINGTAIGKEDYADSKFNTKITFGIYSGGYDYINLDIKSFDENELILNRNGGRSMDIDIYFEIIAIE